jgi:hypothetical protein
MKSEQGVLHLPGLSNWRYTDGQLVCRARENIRLFPDGGHVY